MNTEQKRFDPVYKIASILEMVNMNAQIEEYDKLKRPRDRIFAYALGSSIHEDEDVTGLFRHLVSDVVSNEKLESKNHRLILGNLAILGRGVMPNITYELDALRRGSLSGFLETYLQRMVEGAFSQTPQTYQEPVEIIELYQFEFDRQFGVSPDAKLVADDIYPLVEMASHRLRTVDTFADLIYLASACIYAEGIPTPKAPEKEKKKPIRNPSGLRHDRVYEGGITFRRKKEPRKKSRPVVVPKNVRLKAINRIEGDDLPAGDLFYITALDALQEQRSHLDEREAISQYRRVRTVNQQIAEAQGQVEMFCNIKRKDYIPLAYLVEQEAAEKYNRVLSDPDMTEAEFLSEIFTVGIKEKAKLILKAGIDREDVPQVLKEIAERVRKASFRGLKFQEEHSYKDFRGFVDAIPNRLLEATAYDDRNKDFIVGEEVTPISCWGKISYMHGDEDFDPRSFPLGTVCEVAELKEGQVIVKKKDDEREYAFDLSEVARVVSDPIPLEKESIENGLDAIVDFATSTQFFMFSKDRYKDSLRYAIVYLNKAGQSLDEIRGHIDIKKTGLLEYEKDDSEIEELLPKAPIKPTRMPSLPEGKGRVREILDRTPNIVPYEKLTTGSPQERSLIYLLMPDFTVDRVNEMMAGKDPVERYVLSQMCTLNTPLNTMDQIENHEKPLDELMAHCASAIYQTLIQIRSKKEIEDLHSIPEPVDEAKDDMARFLGRQPRDPSDIDNHDVDELIRSGKYTVIGGDPSSRSSEASMLEAILGKRSDRNKRMASVYYYPEAILGFKLFQGLKEGVDLDGAVKAYHTIIDGYESLLNNARDVDDLLYILATSVYSKRMRGKSIVLKNASDKDSCQEIFLDTILMFLDKTATKASKKFEDSI